jgi:hypothetical protein
MIDCVTNDYYGIREEIEAPLTPSISGEIINEGTPEVVVTEESDVQPETSEMSGTDDSNGEEDNVKGVVRLLQAGHFKGVSDVRLRINFFEDIKALENQQISEAAREGVSGLMESINTAVESFLQSEELDEQLPAVISEAADTLNTGVSTITEGFLNGDNLESSGLVSQLESTFDEFVSSVNPATEQPPEADMDPVEAAPVALDAEEISADVVPHVEEFDEPPPPDTQQLMLEQFVAELIETFTTGIEELKATLDGIKVLPELSEPHGNGKAYDRFLSIYNELRGIDDTNTLDETINAVV